MVKSFRKKANVFNGESNPFNMKINREKRCILGQKTKGTKGLRGQSRAASHAKRKDLWQKTKSSVEKANKFVDKRCMTGSEDSGIDRLILEKKKKIKKNIFNLNEETELLTHKGMPLDASEMTREQKGSVSDDEQLDDSFVAQGHFGGFSSEPKTAEHKSHKEIMEELIVESKKRKYERKMDKEVNEDLTENLDKGWRELLAASRGMKNTNQKTAPEKPDPYTILTNELKFEKRGTPGTRSKTEEELEIEEKERLQKLEKERLLRMNDDVDGKPKNKEDHASADGIYDDFDWDPIPVEDNVDEASATKDESECSDSEAADSDEESADSQESADSDEDMESENESQIPYKDLSDTLNLKVSDIPLSLENFEEFLNTNCFASEKIGEAVKNILNPFLKAKSENTLKKLGVFFGVLIEYASKHLHTNASISCELIPHLHTIVTLSSLHSSEVFLKLLDQEYQNCKKKSKKRKGFLSLKSMLILKYCSVLYSVSDYRHPVVTPAMIFMCDILSSVFPVTFSNVVARLFVCSVAADCVSQSKRFVPEAVCFLNKVLQLAIPVKAKTTSSDTNTKEINLVLHKDSTSVEIVDLNIFNLKSVPNDSKKLSIICYCVSLLHKFCNLYTYLPSFAEIFSETLSLCSQLPVSHYPDSLKNALSSLSSEIKGQEIVLRHLAYPNKKPKPLKMFEPSFESKFTKKDDIKKKFKLLKSVSQKIKKEERGVVREMRRDAEMIASAKLSERLEADAERKRKVKELYRDLAIQEGEYKKMFKKSS